MIPEIRKQWTAALRSDEFRQATGALRVDDRHCCLGVLCELHRRANPDYEWKEPVPGLGYVYDKYISALPESVMLWAGLRSQNPRVTHPLRTLAQMNDDGFTFAEIADVIEEAL